MLDDQRFEKFPALCIKILYIIKNTAYKKSRATLSVFNQTSGTMYYIIIIVKCFHSKNFQYYTSDKIHLSKRKKKRKKPFLKRSYFSCTHVGPISIYRWILIEYVRKRMMDSLSNVNHRSGSVIQDDWPFWETVWIGRSTYFRCCCDLPSRARANSQLSMTIRACSFSKFRKK